MTRRHGRLVALRQVPTPPADPPHAIGWDLLLVGALAVFGLLMGLSLLMAPQPSPSADGVTVVRL